MAPETIAIIGASGEMGRAVAGRLAGGRYRLLLVGRNEEKLVLVHNAIAKAHGQTDMDIVACSKEACWEADVVIMAVPYGTEPDIAAYIGPVTTGKVVISLANTSKGTGDSRQSSAAEELQQLLPYAKIVKAFNTIPAARFEKPATATQRIRCFIAGDDDEAVHTVQEVVTACGFEPVIAGKLVAAGALERMPVMRTENELSA
jgi:predicted dinucleotide-binding enzyme